MNAILDTNIIIYMAKASELANALKGSTPSYASVTAIEALGYGGITTAEAQAIEVILDAAQPLGLTADVINQAIRLRQIKRISLGDAIIAATALVNDFELWTHNLGDFEWIPNLKLVDPLTP